MSSKTLDTFRSRATLRVAGNSYDYYSLAQAERNGLKNVSSLPFSLKVLLENLLRFEDGRSVTDEFSKAFRATSFGLPRHFTAEFPVDLNQNRRCEGLIIFFWSVLWL